MLSQTGQAAAAVVATTAAVVVDRQPHPVVQHVGDVLLRKRVSEKHYVVRASDTIRHVVRRFAENGTLFALLVVSDGVADRGRVLGLVTARDLLRKLDRNGGNMGEGIGDCMTPSAKVVHVRPDDSVQQAALLMSEMRVSHLPVIKGGEVQGIISIQDISNIALEGARSGKESFVKNVLPRTGISEAARVAAAGSGHSSEWQHSHDPLYLKTGVAALPRAKRDETPIEDANFQTHVAWRVGGRAGGAGPSAGVRPLHPPLADRVLHRRGGRGRVLARVRRGPAPVRAAPHATVRGVRVAARAGGGGAPRHAGCACGGVGGGAGGGGGRQLHGSYHLSGQRAE
jgi:CBS domain-containing protein